MKKKLLILLVPLLPVVVFLSIVMGLSSLALRMGEAMPAGPGERFVPPAALGMGMLVLLLLAFVPLLGVPLLVLLQFFARGGGRIALRTRIGWATAVDAIDRGIAERFVAREGRRSWRDGCTLSPCVRFSAVCSPPAWPARRGAPPGT